MERLQQEGIDFDPRMRYEAVTSMKTCIRWVVVLLLLTGVFTEISLNLTRRVHQNPSLKMYHELIGWPLRDATLELSKDYFHKCRLNGFFWAGLTMVPVVLFLWLIKRIPLPSWVSKTLRGVGILLMILMIPFLPGILFGAKLFVTGLSCISVSPTNPQVAAALGHRGFLQGHSFRLILLQPGLNVDMETLREAFEPTRALHEPPEVIHIPSENHRQFIWSEDGTRLVFVQNGWALAAWDFTNNQFSQLRSQGAEELRWEHYFISLLFQGKLLEYQPDSSNERVHRDRFLSTP